MAIRSFGVKVKINSLALGGRTTVKVPGTEVNMIDITDHDSADGYKEFMGGLLDSGTLPVGGNYKPADAGQVYWQANPGATTTFEVELSNGDKFSGSCIIGKFELDDPIDDKVTYSAEAKITGAIVFTPAA